MRGLEYSKFKNVVESILQIANWKLEDAALDWDTVEDVTNGAKNIGEYLDKIQAEIANKFDISHIGFTPPQLIFALSSGKKEVREICRNVRRADSYYVEASRLLMYTKTSNIVAWWKERNKNLNTSLSYIISLFNVHLVSLSGSAVVHSVYNCGEDEISSLVTGIQKNIGNAKNVIKSTELFKYSINECADNMDSSSSSKGETIDSYTKIQAKSKEKHKEINISIMKLVETAGGGFKCVNYEKAKGLDKGLLVDVVSELNDKECLIEFHHKSDAETTNNKVSIYILEKLKEYAINYHLVQP